jgi:hypothetical protein
VNGRAAYYFSWQQQPQLVLRFNLTVAALKPLIIIIPLHLGLFAVAWVVGVYRLQRDVKRIKIMRTLRILAVILAVTLFVAALGRILFPSYFATFQPLLSLLTFPLDTAFLGGNWGLGIAVSIGLMAGSLAVLWQISDNLNLSRAAQETHHFQARRVAFRIGDHDRIRELKDRERLGSMHVTSRIPTFPGSWMMTWKDVLQSLRTLAISRLWSWLVILLLTFSGIVAWVMLEDSLLVGQQTSARFKKDLGNWWLVNSLPLSARRIIIHDVIRPVLAGIAITWIAMWMSSLLGLSISPIVVGSVPFVVVGISFSTVFDMLRQADVGMLLVGRPPDFGLVGLAISMFCIAIPSAIYILTENYSLSPMVGMLAIFLAGISLAALLLRLSERQFRLVG